MKTRKLEYSRTLSFFYQQSNSLWVKLKSDIELLGILEIHTLIKLKNARNHSGNLLKNLNGQKLRKKMRAVLRIADNVLGIAEGGEIEAKSFDFAPRQAKTNFNELNLRNKNE